MLIYINASLYCIISCVYNFLLENILIYYIHNTYITHTWKFMHFFMTFITEWIKQLLDKIQI